MTQAPRPPWKSRTYGAARSPRNPTLYSTHACCGVLAGANDGRHRHSPKARPAAVRITETRGAVGGAVTNLLRGCGEGVSIPEAVPGAIVGDEVGDDLEGVFGTGDALCAPQPQVPRPLLVPYGLDSRQSSSMNRRQTFAMFRAAEPFWTGVSRRISSMLKSE